MKLFLILNCIAYVIISFITLDYVWLAILFDPTFEHGMFARFMFIVMEAIIFGIAEDMKRPYVK